MVFWSSSLACLKSPKSSLLEASHSSSVQDQPSQQATTDMSLHCIELAVETSDSISGCYTRKHADSVSNHGSLWLCLRNSSGDSWSFGSIVLPNIRHAYITLLIYPAQSSCSKMLHCRTLWRTGMIRLIHDTINFRTSK